MTDNEPSQMTRKQFVKLLIAAGGATTAAAMLPDKWIKPKIGLGVLPVHAASSNGPITIAIQQVTVMSFILTYSDPMGLVTDAGQIYVNRGRGYAAQYTISGTTISGLGGSITGNGFSGTFNFAVGQINTAPKIFILLKVGNRESNEIEVLEG
jgi:hypothetical protein